MQLTLEKSYIAGKPVRVDDLGGQLFGGEVQAHKFIVTQYAAQGSAETIAITGSVSGTLMASTGATVPLTGSLEDGKAVVVLDEDCYKVPGRFVLTIFVTSGDVTLCIYCGVGNVLRTSTDTVVYPTESLPNLAQLVDQVQDAIDSFPADLTAIQAAIAANYDDLPYPITAGTYAWHAGTLYKSKTDIATTEAWTAAHWETVHAASDLAANVSQLKSAINVLGDDVDAVKDVLQDIGADLYGEIKVGELTQAYQYLACDLPNGTTLIAKSKNGAAITYGLLLYDDNKSQLGSVTRKSGTGADGTAIFEITIDDVAFLRAPSDIISSDIYIQQGFNAEGKIAQAFNEIGDLSSLKTTTKSSVVSALNEVKQNSVTQTDLSNNLNKMISQELCAIIMGHNDDLRTTLNEQHNYIDFSYNSTNWVMTIPAGTKLIGKNQSVSISSTTTVTFAKQDDWIIAYNLVNNTVDAIRLSSYTTYIATSPNKYLLIATLVSKSPRWISPSINAEYTVNGIPAGFESIYHGIENIKYQMNLDFGDLNGTTGAFTAVNVRRMATVDILQYDYDILVPAATNGIVAYLFTYSDSSGTLDNKIGAINSGTDYVISAGTYFRLLFYKDGDTGSYFGDKRNNFVFNNIFIYRRDDAERFVRISQQQNLWLYNENFRSVAHRGMSRIAPENTIPAYIEARRAGFIYVETDVAWTHDNVAVLLHDTTIDRTSNGTGNIADLDYDDIKDLDFGSWFSPKYAGTKIPTFEEFIQLCRKIGLYPVLDLRSHNQTQLDALISMIIRNGMANHVEFVGGSPSGDYARIKESLPKAGYGYTVASSITEEQIDAMLALKNGQNRVYITASTINSTMIESCADAGIELEFWPAGTEASILALDPYVTGATTEGLIGGWILYASVIPN